MTNWFSQWICRMRGGIFHHTIILPTALSLPLLRGAAVGRAPTIFQNKQNISTIFPKQTNMFRLFCNDLLYPIYSNYTTSLCTCS